MRVIISKLLKDCWLSKGKLLLMLVSAALSAWGISSMIYSYQMAERDFKVNFASTYPADIEVLIGNYQPGLEEKLLADLKIIDLERREVLGARIKNANGEWMPFVLYGAEDEKSVRLNVFRILENRTQEKGKILIETNAQFFLDDTKDSIELLFPEGETIKWMIGGTSHDPRLAPARMERAVFAHSTSLKLLAPHLKNGQRRFLIETNVSSDRQLLEEVSERIKKIAKSEGSEVLSLVIPTPGEHIHQNIVDGISFLQKSMGGIISLMGIILLSLILLTWVFPRISDLGIMKAIGASSIRLFYAYLMVLSLIILLGLIIGLPLGYETARAYNNLVAFVQNFEPVTDAFPFWIHLLVAFVAMLIPLTFAAFPLLKASKTTVQQAINKTFYLANKRIFQFSQRVFQDSSLKYSLNNLFRNSSRSLLMLMLVAVGLGLFLTGANLEYSVKKELENFANSAKYGLKVRFSGQMKQEEVSFIRDLPFVESISAMDDKTVHYKAPNAFHSNTRNLRILSPQHEIKEEFVLLGQVDKSCSDCLYISGEAMRQEFEDKQLGHKIELTMPSGEKNTFVYSGIFKDMAAIGSPFFAYKTSKLDSFTALAIEIKSDFTALEVTNGVDDAFLEKGIDVAGMINVNTRLGQLQGHLEPTYLIIKVMGLVTLVLGLLGLIIVLNLCIQERTRELGILKSLGSSFGKMVGLFRLEFFWIGIGAIFLSILLTMPLNAALCKVLGETVIYHQIPPRNFWSLIGLSSVIFLLIQYLLITAFSWFRIRKSANAMMAHQF